MDCSFRNNVCVEPITEVDRVDIVAVDTRVLAYLSNNLQVHYGI